VGLDLLGHRHYATGTMTNQEQSGKTFKDEAARLRARVGKSARERLEWALRMVRAGQGGMTSGEKEDFRAALGVFAKGGTFAESAVDSPSAVEVPSPQDAQIILDNMTSIVSAAVGRQGSNLFRRSWTNTRLVWNRTTGRFVRMSDAAAFNWTIGANDTLGHLIEDFGHLVRRCGVTESQQKQTAGACGQIFLALREGQEFCSARCRARAGMRRFRSKAKAKKKTTTHRTKKGA
jgi:hypothetical protein